MNNKNINDLYDKLDSIDKKLQKQINIEKHRDSLKKESESYNNKLIKIVIFVVYMPFIILILYSIINHENLNDLISASAFIVMAISYLSFLKD